MSRPAPLSRAGAKILFVSHAADKGGAELFLRDILVRDREHARNWTALFFQDGPIVPDIAQHGGRAIVNPCEPRLLSVKRGAGPVEILRSVTAACKFVARLVPVFSDYAVICANTQKSLFIAGVAAAFARRPFVWILHDIVTDVSFSRTSQRLIVLTANRLAAVVIANSEATKRAFIEAGGNAARVTVVYNGFDTSGATADDRRPAALRRERFPDWSHPERSTIGVFGRLTEWKGQHVLIEALARTEDVQAIVVGDSTYQDSDYKDALVALVARLGLSDRVRFLGFQADVPGLMACVDMVAHTSTHPEPFGRVIVEGMLQDRPVIATSGGGVDEIIEDGQTGVLVPPGDPAALARAIETLVADPHRAGAIARRGQVHARETFSIKTTVARLSEILEGLALGRRQR